MRRRLFNLAAAVSLVLCAATVVLWVRGDSAPQSFPFPGWDGWIVVPARGAVMFVEGFGFSRPGSVNWENWNAAFPVPWHSKCVDWSVAGIRWHEDGSDDMWDF